MIPTKLQNITAKYYSHCINILRNDKNTTAVRLIVLSFGIVLLFLLFQEVTILDIAKVFYKINLNFFFIAVTISFVITFIRVIRYKIYFPSLNRWMKLYGGFAFLRLMNIALPFRSGELVFLSILKKYRLAPSIIEAASVWFIIKTTDLLSFSLLFFTAMGLVSFSFRAKLDFEWIRWCLVGISGIALIVMIYLPFIASKISYSDGGGLIIRKIEQFSKGIKKAQNLKTFFITVIISIMIWGAQIIFTTCLQLTFGAPLPLASCLIISVSALAFSLLPIHAPMGIGTGESVWAGLFFVSGIESAQAIAIAINIRLVILMLTLIEGLTGLYLLKRFSK